MNQVTLWDFIKSSNKPVWRCVGVSSVPEKDTDTAVAKKKRQMGKDSIVAVSDMSISFTSPMSLSIKDFDEKVLKRANQIIRYEDK